MGEDAREALRELARQLVLPALACVTLGLAPFAPEPHVVGKLRWVLGGARGMRLVDWFDLVFHGFPWLWLSLSLGRAATRSRRGPLRWSMAAVLVALIGAAVCVLWSLASS